MAYGIVWCWECWVRKRQAYPPPLKGIPSQRFSSLSNLWASGLPKMLDGKILCVFYHQRVTCQHQCAQRKVLTHNAQSGNQSCISRDFSIQNKTVKKNSQVWGTSWTVLQFTLAEPRAKAVESFSLSQCRRAHVISSATSACPEAHCDPPKKSVPHVTKCHVIQGSRHRDALRCRNPWRQIAYYQKRIANQAAALLTPEFHHHIINFTR